jgi:hypothetical protein
MLLDTMCNTFGGVCFIALMVAIISASLPSKKDLDATNDSVSEQMVVDKETVRLKRERDELKTAIDIQKSFIATNTTKESRVLSVAQLATSISSNSTALIRLKNEKFELEDKLAKLTTDSEYSSREARRLELIPSPSSSSLAIKPVYLYLPSKVALALINVSTSFESPW